MSAEWELMGSGAPIPELGSKLSSGQCHEKAELHPSALKLGFCQHVVKMVCAVAARAISQETPALVRELL